MGQNLPLVSQSLHGKRRFVRLAKDIIMRYLAPLCQTTMEDRVVASDRPILEAVC